MFCRKCGTQLADDAMFCGECGAPTRNHPGQQRTQGQPQPGQPYQGQPYQQPQGFYEQPYNGQYMGNGSSGVKPKFSAASRRTLITVVIVAVIAAAAGLLYNLVLKTRGPEDTIHELEAAIEDLDLDKIVACFDEETREAYEEELAEHGDIGLESVMGLAGGLGIGPKVDIAITDIEYIDGLNCQVSVDVEISFMGESEDTSDMLLMKKEGKKWVIDGEGSADIMGGLF